MNMPKGEIRSHRTPSPHSYSGAKGMGEGGAAPIHTISAALQDALFASGIMIDDSFNMRISLFRAMVAKEISQADKLIRVERRVVAPPSPADGRKMPALPMKRVCHRRVWGHWQPVCGRIWRGLQRYGLFRPPRRSRASTKSRRPAGLGKARVSCISQGYNATGTASGLRTCYCGDEGDPSEGMFFWPSETVLVRAQLFLAQNGLGSEEIIACAHTRNK